MVTLVAKTRGKPALSICGIITEPIADVSATAEPEMPLRKVVASTLTTAKPPRTRVKPTSTSAKATRRRAMPPSAMMARASTKNGMVSMATLLTPSDIFSMTASSGMPIHKAATIDASASEYAMGTPIAKQKNIVVNRIAISMRFSLCVDSVQRFVEVLRVGRCPEDHPFDSEQEKERATDWNRQVSDTDRQKGKIGNCVVPCGLDQFRAINEHEYCHHGHQQFGEKVSNAMQ